MYLASGITLPYKSFNFLSFKQMEKKKGFVFVPLEFIAPQSGEKYWKDLMFQKKKKHRNPDICRFKYHGTFRVQLVIF